VDGIWERVKYSFKRDAFLQLPSVSQHLNTVFTLPGTEGLGAAGNGGLILHSPDSGEPGRRQT
jgi:hypothetical protein